jgi:prepilin-type N-terminal cleavage/methylation domain-containing protein
MKIRQNKSGVTLVEMLIVVAIIAILATMVIGIAFRIDTQSKEQLAKNTLALLDAALGQFQDYDYEYKLVSNPRTNEAKFYRSLDFPIDCNGLNYNDFRSELGHSLGTTSGAAVITVSGIYDPYYSGSAALYFFLSKVPECRKTLDKIDRKLITNLDRNGDRMEIRIQFGGDFKYSFFRFIDPWGTPLQYNYYDHYNETGSWQYRYLDRIDSEKTFPVITSAGPDKEFGTADDIKSR